MEQATLVRRTVEDQGVPQAREHRENVVPLQSRPREVGVGPYAPVELSHEEIELLAEIATGVTTEVDPEETVVTAQLTSLALAEEEDGEEVEGEEGEAGESAEGDGGESGAADYGE